MVVVTVREKLRGLRALQENASRLELLPLLSVRIKCFHGIACGEVYEQDETSRLCVGMEKAHLPSVFGGDKSGELTLHIDAPHAAPPQECVM